MLTSASRLLADNLVHSSLRTLPCRPYFVLKTAAVLIIVILFAIVVRRSMDRGSPSATALSRKRHPSLSPVLLQNFILMKMNTTQSTLVVTPAPPPANYHDPFIHSRIQFTHSDEQRPEASRKWCQAQSKAIRPQDLEPFKCAEIKQFDNTEHLFCLDPVVRNSCLVMSVSVGSHPLDDTFDNQLYEWGGCRMLTFDPYYQPAQINRTITVKSNWTFYRLGLTASAAVDDNSNFMTIGKLGEHIQLDSLSGRIDILRIDIDNANEWSLLDDGDFFVYICRHVKQLIIKTKPIHSKRFQHYRIFTLKLNRCFALLRRRSRLYLLGRHNQFESEWSLATFSLNLGLFCDEIDMSMYLLVYGHLYLVNTKL